MQTLDLLAVWVVLFVILVLAILLFLSLRIVAKISKDNKEVQLAQIALVNKLGSLLASKDAMSYQAIQAMDQVLPEGTPVTLPTEEELFDLLVARDARGEKLTEAEYDIIERAAFGESRDFSDPR